MTQELYVDGIGNISVQGPVVTLTFVRSRQGAGATTAEGENVSEVINLTMAGNNLVKITNVLNNVLNKMASKAAGEGEVNSEGRKSVATGAAAKSSTKKNKTVN